MNFEPASEGFLDFFKKKSKQPSKVEKSNILNKMTPGKSINYEEISQKLADMYPDDAKKEFDNRRKYLKVILNAITEVSKKYKNILGIEFDSAINMIKCFIDGKDYEDKETGFDKPYEEFFFMNELLPAYILKKVSILGLIIVNFMFHFLDMIFGIGHKLKIMKSIVEIGMKPQSGGVFLKILPKKLKIN